MSRMSPIPECGETEEHQNIPAPASQQIEVSPSSSSKDDPEQPPSQTSSSTETEDEDWLLDKLDSPFFEQYDLRLDEKVPPGGRSKCFKCREKKTGRPFFVKIVKSGKIAKAEVNILTVCKGMEGVVELIDVITHKGYVYMILEDLTGGEAFDRLTDDIHFDEEKARALMQKVSKGVSNLHRFGVIHGDLKLENLVFVDKTEESEVKVVDFGGSGLSPRLLHKAKVHTTLPYRAPEIFGNVDKITTQSDMWSMGVILFVVLTGIFPFDDEECRTMNLNGQGCSIDRSTEEWLKLSKAAQDLVIGLLEVDPEKRLDMEEFESHRWMQGTDETLDSSSDDSTEEEDESESENESEDSKSKRQRLDSDECDSRRG